jgi:hypothetical protein
MRFNFFVTMQPPQQLLLPLEGVNSLLDESDIHRSKLDALHSKRRF